VQYHSIHYIDAMRSILGDPIWITSRHARNPLQGEIVGETKTITVMDYDTDLQVLIADNHYNHSDDYFAVFRFIGTEG
ncbi:MAG: gfo/Idh/MocA family oxidoreductase, partial [Anaerolineae bacterium]|nr:gfo/Idh/MocA family oxidoreductase [Anaerolineae bacterium]